MSEAVYKVGFGISDITFFREGLGLMGYMVPGNTAKSVRTPLYARACSIEDREGNLAVLACAEIAYISEILKQTVIGILEEDHPGVFRMSNVMLTAQHTHAAISGISAYFLHNSMTPGFQEDAMLTYARGLASSILEAWENREQASLRYGEADFAPGEEVAFNRSLKALSGNPEIGAITEKEAAFGVDRTMKQIEAVGTSGELLGVVNWFGVHCTSMSNRNTEICSDNKGFAAARLERYVNADSRSSERPFVALFVVDTAGDVTPNFIYPHQKRRNRDFTEDYDKVLFNGRLQFEKARQILKAVEKEPVSGKVASHLHYVDITKSPDTSWPALGVSMLEGTLEGPGMPRTVGQFTRFLSRIARRRQYAKALREGDESGLRFLKSQGNKDLVINAGKGTILGWRTLKTLLLPVKLEPMLKHLHMVQSSGFMQFLPWFPLRLPLQVLRLGSVVVGGIPAELSTISGRRLRKTVEDSWGGRPMLVSLANEYAGYVTTAEEYQAQQYEGGHTLYGKGTLQAWQTYLSGMPALAERNSLDEAGALIDMAKVWRGE